MVGWPAETPPATLKNSSPKLGEVPVRAEECVDPATLKNSSPKLVGELPASLVQCTMEKMRPGISRAASLLLCVSQMDYFTTFTAFLLPSFMVVTWMFTPLNGVALTWPARFT